VKWVVSSLNGNLGKEVLLRAYWAGKCKSCPRVCLCAAARVENLEPLMIFDWAVGHPRKQSAVLIT
jgi:hypothetical protein